MRVLLVGLLSAMTPFASCLNPNPGVCTALFAYGVNVTLTDAAGAPIHGATLTLIDGDYTEQMTEIPTGAYVGAGERAGTYTLTIEAVGYQTATLTDLVVTADECHVIGISRTVALTAAQ